VLATDAVACMRKEHANQRHLIDPGGKEGLFSMWWATVFRHDMLCGVTLHYQLLPASSPAASTRAAVSLDVLALASAGHPVPCGLHAILAGLLYV
jgi:hypothetical protein